MQATLFVIATLLGAPVAKDAPKGLATIVGDWVVESAVLDGGRLETSGERYLFRADGTWTTFGSDGKARGEPTRAYRVDAKESPANVDLWYGSDPRPERVHPGIYRLDGDTLTICKSASGAVRPTKFASAAGSDHLLITLKRVVTKKE
jgi:uncharacterized protein (TIGR03067 family)